MQRWRGQDEIPTDWGRCVLTIGVFDGVHRGHAELIAHAVKAGRARGVPAVLMTFDPHPMEVVYPGSHPAQLTTLTRRAELVQDLGIEVFLVMPFTTDFMKLTPDRFIHELLVEHLHVVEVVVGENFTFGKKAAGNVDTLRRAGERFGFAVESMSLVSEHHSNETVTFSSTYIRSCVDAGDMVAAMEALGRPHRVEGVVVRGEGRGAELGFPTANVAPPMYSAIPADGVYAAWFTVLGHGPVTGTVVPGERYQAAVSVGTNPTFSGRTRTVEAFVLDTTADLYGQHVALTSSGVSAARRSSNRCASWSLRWVPIPSGHVTCCLRVDGSCGRDPGWHLRRLCLAVNPLLDCPTTSVRAAVRGGRALISMIANPLMETFRGADSRAKRRFCAPTACMRPIPDPRKHRSRC